MSSQIYEDFIFYNDMYIHLSLVIREYYKMLKDGGIPFTDKIRLSKKIKDNEKKQKELAKKLKENGSIIDSLCSFDDFSFLILLSKVFSKVYKKEFCAINDVEVFNNAGTFLTHIVDNEVYDIVSTTKNISLIEQCINVDFYTKEDDIFEVLGKLEDSECVCLRKHKKYSLTNGGLLIDELKIYPFLEDIVKEIVRIRTDEPSISEKDLIDCLINCIPTKELIF